MKFNIEKMMQEPTIDWKSFWIDTVDEITHEIIKEMHLEDSLEVVLVKDEYGFGNFKMGTIEFMCTLDVAEFVKIISFRNLAKAKKTSHFFSIDYAIPQRSIPANQS